MAIKRNKDMIDTGGYMENQIDFLIESGLHQLD